MNTKDSAGHASEFTRNYGYCSTGLILATDLVENPPAGIFSVILTHTSPGYSGPRPNLLAHQPPSVTSSNIHDCGNNMVHHSGGNYLVKEQEQEQEPNQLQQMCWLQGPGMTIKDHETETQKASVEC
jgi:hypothetical protein